MEYMNASLLILIIFFGTLANTIDSHAQSEDLPIKLDELKEEMSAIRSEIQQASKNSENSFWLAFSIGAILASIAIIATLRSSQELREQTNHLEDQSDIMAAEMKLRLRPILSRISFSNSASSVKIFDDEIRLRLRNNGPLPALKIKKETMIGIKENDIINNRMPESGYRSHVSGALGPNESIAFGIESSEIHCKEAKEGENCYFEFRLTYHDYDDVEYFYIINGHFSHGSLTVDESTMN